MVAVRHGLAGLVVVLISLRALVGLLTKVDDASTARSDGVQHDCLENEQVLHWTLYHGNIRTTN